jgi:hypothetical protein
MGPAAQNTSSLVPRDKDHAFSVSGRDGAPAAWRQAVSACDGEPEASGHPPISPPARGAHQPKSPLPTQHWRHLKRNLKMYQSAFNPSFQSIFLPSAYVRPK